MWLLARAAGTSSLSTRSALDKLFAVLEVWEARRVRPALREWHRTAMMMHNLPAHKRLAILTECTSAHTSARHARSAPADVDAPTATTLMATRPSPAAVAPPPPPHFVTPARPAASTHARLGSGRAAHLATPQRHWWP